MAPRGSPSANAFGLVPENAYEALAGKSFNYHFGRRKKALKDQKGKCMFCFGAARNPDHNLCDCPILKNLGLRIKKRSTADNLDREAASCLAAAASPASGATPPLTNHPPPDNPAGVASVQGTFGASTSGDEFNYEGKVDGAMYGRGGKSNATSAYLSHLAVLLP